MSYLKKVFYNYLTLGITLGLIPFITSKLFIDTIPGVQKVAYILLLTVPTIVNVGVKEWKN